MDDSPEINKDGEDFIELPASNSPGSGSENVNNDSSTNKPGDSESQPSDCRVNEGQLNGEILVIEKSEYSQVTLAANNEHGSAFEVNNTIIENKVSVLTENGSVVEDGIHKRNGSPVSNHESYGTSNLLFTSLYMQLLLVKHYCIFSLYDPYMHECG